MKHKMNNQTKPSHKEEKVLISMRDYTLLQNKYEALINTETLYASELAITKSQLATSENINKALSADNSALIKAQAFYKANSMRQEQKIAELTQNELQQNLIAAAQISKTCEIFQEKGRLRDFYKTLESKEKNLALLSKEIELKQDALNLQEIKVTGLRLADVIWRDKLEKRAQVLEAKESLLKGASEELDVKTKGFNNLVEKFKENLWRNEDELVIVDQNHQSPCGFEDQVTSEGMLLDSNEMNKTVISNANAEELLGKEQSLHISISKTKNILPTTPAPTPCDESWEEDFDIINSEEYDHSNSLKGLTVHANQSDIDALSGNKVVSLESSSKIRCGFNKLMSASLGSLKSFAWSQCDDSTLVCSTSSNTDNITSSSAAHPNSQDLSAKLDSDDFVDFTAPCSPYIDIYNESLLEVGALGM